jgi:DNA-binding MarR family transcriptional regulator/N-acetylglutamate synthase-like GNAT family acetyltransferase
MTAAAVERFRAFNRFYTGLIGALDEGLLDTRFSLTEARVLFELGRGGELAVAALRQATGLDAGYLSRILAAFDESGLVRRRRSDQDARRQLVELTDAGVAAYRELDERSATENGEVLRRLSPRDRETLLGALETVERLLGGEVAQGRVTVRQPEAGDLGWMVERHGALYAAEYGWDASFEALVARIVADFGAEHDPARERAWIAELDGRRAGCILCVRADGETAKLRILLVEPWARGHGIGSRLVDECIAFARAAGYRRMVLWTNDVLVAARRIYERAGFELVEEGKHHAFGHDLVEQTWARNL